MIKKNKKAQATLPFFGLQLASVIVFLVVVISLLLLRRNLILLANEFDVKTEHILMTRRLLSSADCLAFEEKDNIFFNGLGGGFIVSGKRVYPYIVDVKKLDDLNRINCMRKDFFDTPADANRGIMDPLTGTGAASRYEISVFNIATGEYVTFGGTNAAPETRVISEIGQLKKVDIKKCSLDIQCQRRFGKDYNCSGDGLWCSGSGNWFRKTLCLPLDLIDMAWATGYCLSESENIPRALNDLAPGEKIYNLTFYRDLLDCSNEVEKLKRTSFPIMLKTDNSLDPGIMYLQTCQVSAANYKGIPFCDRSFKSTGEEGC